MSFYMSFRVVACQLKEIKEWKTTKIHQENLDLDQTLVQFIHCSWECAKPPGESLLLLELALLDPVQTGVSAGRGRDWGTPEILNSLGAGNTGFWQGLGGPQSPLQASPIM